MPKIVDHDERRRHIVDALWRVVNRDGASEVSVRHVAAEAGMPKSSIGHYVGTMPQLLGLATDQLIEQVTSQAMSLDLYEVDRDRVVEVLAGLVPVDQDRRNQSGIWLLVLSQSPSDPDVAEVLKRLNDAVDEAIAEVLRTMVRHGLMDDSRDIARETRRLHALIDGLSVHSLSDPSARSNDEVRAVLAEEIAALGSPAVVGVG